MKLHRLVHTLIFRSAAVLVSVSVLTMQISAQAPAQAVVPSSATVTVASGTHMPAVLLTQVVSKGLKPGKAVRAQIVFPQTVGKQLAVPAGTYVEGVVEAAAPATKQNKQPLPPLHFTRLLLADGTVVPIDATAVAAGSAEVLDPPTEVQTARAGGPSADDAALSFTAEETLQSSTTSTTNPFAHSGPNPGLFIGLGITAAVILGFIIYAIHRGHVPPTIWYAANWQFDLVLQAPLVVGTAHVNASAAMPVH